MSDEAQCDECKKRGEYIIHLLHKQNAVMGLNDQDKDWIKKLGCKIEEDE